MDLVFAADGSRRFRFVAFDEAPIITAKMSPPTFISPLLPRRQPCSTTSRGLSGVHPRRPRVWRAAASPDFYEVLDVTRDADGAAVKRAYRRAALKNHPDVSKAPDAKERFMRVQQAYSVLSDPTKRASYDRRSSTGFSSSTSSSWPGGSDASGFDPSDYVRRWRENNPMPNDLNDSFGSIFSDLFSGVAGAASGASRPGIMDDFVEFLEKQVEGFGVNSSGYASDDDDDGLDDILQSSDVDVLQAEIEDTRFVLEQLETRLSKLDEEATSLRRRADEWGARADRADKTRDYMTRDAARERRDDLVVEAKRFAVRSRKTQSQIQKQRDRLKKIERRLETVKKQKKEPKSARAKAPVDPKASQKEVIDEELERMKRELGL